MSAPEITGWAFCARLMKNGGYNLRQMVALLFFIERMGRISSNSKWKVTLIDMCIINNIATGLVDYKNLLNKATVKNNNTFMGALERFICRLEFFVKYHRWPDSECIDSPQHLPQIHELISWLDRGVTGTNFILRDGTNKYVFRCLDDKLVSIELKKRQGSGDQITLSKDEFVISGLSGYLEPIRRQYFLNIFNKIGLPSSFSEYILTNISNDLRTGLNITSLYEKVNDICKSYFLEKKEKGEYTRPLPQHLTFDGGGSKGIYYTPVMDVLQKTGFLGELKAVYGTSIGSVAATLRAFDIDMSEITEFALGCDDIIDDTYLCKYDGFEISSKTGVANGMALVSKLDEKIMSVIKNWFDTGNHSDDTFSELNSIRNKVNSFFENPSALRNDRNMITFADLHTLSKYDSKFKLLTITATNSGTGKAKYFSVLDTPDVSVCKAVRASTAYPGVFKAVEIDGEQYIDGGFCSNSSLAAVKEANSSLIASLLFFRPDQHGGSDFYNRIYKSSDNNEYNIEKLSPVMAGLGNLLVKDYSHNENQDAKRIYDLGTNAIPVWHGEGDNDIGTFAFNISDDSLAYNGFIARMYTYNYLNNYWI